MNHEIEKIVNVLPIIKQLYDKDMYITVLDRDGIVCGYSIPDGQRAQVEIGSRFTDPSGGFAEVIRTGKRKYNYLPKEVMGEAFEGYLVPITEAGKVVGCLISSYSAEAKARLGEIAGTFGTSVRQVNEKISHIVSEFSELYEKFDEVNQMTGKVQTDVNATEKIVGVIGSNASKSNILALNASIEAARSGEHGRGFAVVAQEMGKLAKDSSNSTAEIQKQLQEVHKSLDAMVHSIQGTDSVAQNYNNEIKEIQEVMSKMLELSATMENSVKAK